MRTIIIVLVGALLPAIVTAQNEEQDPFQGSYILGNSAELMVIGDKAVGSERGWWCQTYDFNQDISDITSIQEEWGFSTDNNLWHYIDAVSGDFNGDGFDDVVSVDIGTVFLMISSYSNNILNWEYDSYSFRTPPTSIAFSQILTGNFDYDPQQEFAVCTENKILIFEADSSLKICKLDSAEIQHPRNVKFGFTSGDFNRDGLDDIVVVTNEVTSESTQFIIHIYKCESPNKFTLQSVKTIPISDGLSDYQIVLASGNLNNDNWYDIVMGFQKTTSYIWGGGDDHVKTYLLPFEISMTLDSIKYNTTRLIHDETFYFPYPCVIYFYAYLSQTIECRDLNGDGRDEVVFVGGQYFTIYSSDNELHLTQVARYQSHTSGCFQGSYSRKEIAIADLNADTLQQSWKPEIVLLDWTYHYCEAEHGNPLNYGPGTVRVFETDIDNPSYNDRIRQLSEYETTIDRSMGYSIILGDFDGDAIRFKNPRKLRKEEVVQPLVVLNMPPTHFDILGDTLDVCNAYPIPDNEQDINFKASYTCSINQSHSAETEFHRDWGLSAKLSGGGSFLGIGVSASLEARYGEKFSKLEGASKSLSVESGQSAYADDWIIGIKTDYHFWEYPLYVGREKQGNILAVHPGQLTPIITGSKELTDERIAPDHEVGNILSYKSFTQLTDNPDLAQPVTDLENFPERIFSPSGAGYMEISFLDENYNSVTNEQEFGFTVGASISGWGFELETEASYDQNQISSHSATFSENVVMKVEFGTLDGTIGAGIDYAVRPYIYWSKKNTLVLDYNVQPNEGSGLWWQTNYGQYPDLSFILPWRYDPEKGLSDDSPEANRRRHKTSDISFHPSAPSVGDTITIISRIHNFSMMPISDSVSVRFHDGDPDSGGEPLTDIHGHTKHTKYINLARTNDILYETEEYFSFEWAIPADLNYSPLIYTVIDADNAISEIHENNNKGYRLLSIEGLVTRVEDEMELIIPTQFVLYQNYPNPFNPITRIKYQVPETIFIKIKIYDVLGREIATLVNEEKPIGTYEVEFNAAHLASGIYFYRIQAGSFDKTKKMVLIK